MKHYSSLLLKILLCLGQHLCHIAVAKKEAYGDTALLNRLLYRQIRPKLHMQKCLDIRGSLGSHKLKSGKKLNAIFAFWLIS